MERQLGPGRTMDRERRVGENPGPARTSPENSALSDVDVAEYARKAAGFRLRDAWRNTPHRARLNGLLPSDYACAIPLSDIGNEFDVRQVIRRAVSEMCVSGDEERLTSWILETITEPIATLRGDAA